MKKVAFISLLLISALVLGFFIGRKTIDTKVTTKLVTGQLITGSINPQQFNLISEKKPEHIQYLDTVRMQYVFVPVDTVAIIADYELKRKYSVLAFDDLTKGRLELFPTIQYNKLTGFDYNYTPVIEKNYIYGLKIWQPFASVSYSTLDYLGFGGGTFYHNLGFEYQYNLDLRKKTSLQPPISNYYKRGNYHWFSLKYKF